MKKSLNILEEQKPWYAHGLRFECTQCGKCCTGAPGYTWVTEEEVATIAAHLNLSIPDFMRKYVRVVRDRLSLLEHSKTYDCVFLKDKKCQIYSVRPKQCRTFPWWPELLNSREDWEQAATFCEGIRSDAPVVSYETIKHQLDLQES